MNAPALPRCTVLLAAYNGRQWIDAQLDSILGQLAVQVRVVVSDDGSEDGTWERLRERAAADSRIELLDPVRTGSSAANFFRLIREADLSGADAISLSDQDDIWYPDKLAKHIRMLGEGLDGVSSDVTAVEPDGSRRPVVKSQPQRDADYLFESAGPGCSFVMSPRLAALIREALEHEQARAIGFHDWLFYALCRARGWRWRIDDAPSLDYRQHGGNVLGVNDTAASARSRFAMIRNRYYRDQVARVATACLGVAVPETRATIARVAMLARRPGLRSSWALAAHAGTFRRRTRDRLVLRTLMLLGLW